MTPFKGRKGSLLYCLPDSHAAVTLRHTDHIVTGELTSSQMNNSVREWCYNVVVTVLGSGCVRASGHLS